jgi:hypothetical protein
MFNTLIKTLKNFVTKHRSRNFTWFMIILTWVLFIVHTYTLIQIPLFELMYALMFVVGAYTGVDQFAAVMATRKLPSGEKYEANSDKLYAICFGILILLALALFLAYNNPNIEYPLDLVFLSTGVVLGSFVAGEKGKNIFEKK